MTIGWAWALVTAYLLGAATVFVTLAALTVRPNVPPEPPAEPPADDGWAEAAELLGVPLHDYQPRDPDWIRGEEIRVEGPWRRR